MDASQGVEAQTMANVYLALENNLEIITCVNKIDLPNADAEKVMQEVESTIGLDTSNSIKCSAKTGMYISIRLIRIFLKLQKSSDNTSTRKFSIQYHDNVSILYPTLSTSGLGIEDILEAIVHTLPPPVADSTLPLRALIFDSYYDAYRGVVVFFRVVDGEIRKGDKIRFMNSGVEYEVLEVGVMTPVQVKVDVLRCCYSISVMSCAHTISFL